jgi:hypothetical protein
LCIRVHGTNRLSDEPTGLDLPHFGEAKLGVIVGLVRLLSLVYVVALNQYLVHRQLGSQYHVTGKPDRTLEYDHRLDNLSADTTCLLSGNDSRWLVERHDQNVHLGGNMRRRYST